MCDDCPGFPLECGKCDHLRGNAQGEDDEVADRWGEELEDHWSDLEENWQEEE